MTTPRLLVLLPFLIKGALSIEIFRALRERGVPIAVAFCSDASTVYATDPLEDFDRTGDRIDLTSLGSAERLRILLARVDRDAIDVVVQVGAADLYHLLPQMKEQRPELKLVDILYNEIGHTLNHFMYERCFAVTLVESDFMHNFIRRASTVAHKRVVVVHSGVDLHEYSPAELPSLLRPIRIGYVGRMSPEKNPLGFVELAERLGTRQPSLRFVLCGAGVDSSVVTQRIAESSVADRIDFQGFVPRMRDAMREIDVLVLPSRVDGRPVTVLEANACGVPVIGAPVGGVPELLYDGINGFLAYPTEYERIASLVDSWIQDPRKLIELKASSRAYAVAHFDRESMIDAYASAFSDLTGT